MTRRGDTRLKENPNISRPEELMVRRDELMEYRKQVTVCAALLEQVRICANSELREILSSLLTDLNLSNTRISDNIITPYLNFNTDKELVLATIEYSGLELRTLTSPLFVAISLELRERESFEHRWYEFFFCEKDVNQEEEKIRSNEAVRVAEWEIKLATAKERLDASLAKKNPPPK